MNRHLQLFNRLTKLAGKHQYSNCHRLIAAVVKKNTIISYGVNHYKTSPLQLKYSKNSHAIYMHAEIAAIQRAISARLWITDLAMCDIYVARLKHFTEENCWGWGLATPCIGCARAIAMFNFRRLVYTNNSADKTNYTIINL